MFSQVILASSLREGDGTRAVPSPSVPPSLVIWLFVFVKVFEIVAESAVESVAVLAYILHSSIISRLVIETRMLRILGQQRNDLY